MSKINKIMTNVKECAICDIKNGNIKDEDQLRDYINQCLESACIYTSDCYEILSEEMVTDFSDLIRDFGCTSIDSFAYFTLTDKVEEYGLFGELCELLEELK